MSSDTPDEETTLDQFVNRSEDQESTESSSTITNHSSGSDPEQDTRSRSASDEDSVDDQNPEKRDSLELDNPHLQTESKIITRCLHNNAGVTLKESSAIRYCTSLRFYEDFISGIGVLNADRSDVWEFLKHRVRNDRSKETVMSDLSAIKKLYKWIDLDKQHEAEIKYVDLTRLDISAFQFSEPAQREPLETDELESLYDAMDRTRDRLMVSVGAETGARNNDICRIKLSRLDIDDDDPKIEMTNTKTGGTYPSYISQILATDIKFFIDHKRPAYPSHQDSDYLFLSHHGGRLSSGYFTKIVKEAAKDAGIQQVIATQATPEGERDVHRVTPHTLRHTFNHLMEKEDVPVEYRAKALDQDSLEVNRKYYSHDDSGHREYVKKLHDR